MPDINYVKMLLEMSDEMLSIELENVQLAEFRKNLKLSLKMQDRDTRHACAEKVLQIEVDVTRSGLWRNQIHRAVINTKTI